VAIEVLPHSLQGRGFETPASYLLLLARRLPRLAFRYLDLALGLCERCGIGPALVMHPTDLLDATDSPALRRFPGMDVPARSSSPTVGLRQRSPTHSRTKR
jgi:hypothetical protein